MKIHRCVWLVLLGVSWMLMGGCQSDHPVAAKISGSTIFGTRIKVPMGTPLDVRLASTVSSKTASVGDVWTGTLVKPVVERGREGPAGRQHSRGNGRERGSRPSAGIARGSSSASGRAARGSKIALRAGRPGHRRVATRRNLRRHRGRRCGRSPALGRAIGGDGDDAASGRDSQGAVATGAVRGFKGYQVELRNGTTLTFLVSREVAVLWTEKASSQRRTKTRCRAVAGRNSALRPRQTGRRYRRDFPRRVGRNEGSAP
jgi:hypothetical protein